VDKHLAPTSKALILTALPVEYASVRVRLRSLREATHPEGTVYEIGDFADEDNNPWSVFIAEIGPGNVASATETERAISYFKPDVVFFVGIAGGVKDVSVGDVVAATKVYGYEYGKVTEVFRPRPDSYRSSYPLEQRARAEAKRNIHMGSGNTGFSVLVAPIASGDKVIASRRNALARFLRAQYGDAVAVEMEGMGFMFAAAAHLGVSTLVVRGISDLLSNKAKSEARGSHKTAADNASAVAFQILSKLKAQRSGEIAESTKSKTFTKDSEIDSLLSGVMHGELKTAMKPALGIVRRTEADGQNKLFERLLSYIDCSDQDDMFWKALTAIEACCELAPSLVDRRVLKTMADHKNFSVRSSAAFICMNLAQFAPELVPLDIIEKLSVHDEDWYVQAPANAALKAMVREIPSVLYIFFSRLHSLNSEERGHAASMLVDVASKEPELIDKRELRFEIMLMEKLKDEAALRYLRPALNLVEKAKRYEGYKYGI